MCRSKDHGLLVQLRRDADVEAALIRPLRFLVGLFAQSQVIIDGIVEIADQLRRRGPLIGEQRTDAHDFSVKEAVFFREFHASHIAFVFHRVIHRSPSCSKIWMSCFT